MSLTALQRGLAAIPEAQMEPPATGRVGATLVLLEPLADDHVRIIYTRRAPTLSSHPGQISFPGGRVDPGEGIVAAAIREAGEEIALDPGSVTVLGRLPVFYIPPSRFWMSAVVARWDQPHELVANPDEVTEVLAIDTTLLRDPKRWRSVALSATGASWAWQLAPGQLLWGATAVVTGVLLDIMDAGWSGGRTPADLPADARVRPWEDPGSAGAVPATIRSRARLRDVPTEVVDLGGQGDAVPDADALADDVVHALRLLVHRPSGPVVVLAGEGSAGAAARMVVGELVGEGEEVVLLDLDDARDGPLDDAEVTAALRRAGVIVDGLAGRGFTPPMSAPMAAVVGALAAVGTPLIAIDLPSGIDAQAGLVGETVSADVTVAPAPLCPGHVAPGTLPFVGDLYLSRPGHRMVRAQPTGRPTAWAE